jgi:hypothetical protein
MLPEKDVNPVLPELNTEKYLNQETISVNLSGGSSNSNEKVWKANIFPGILFFLCLPPPSCAGAFPVF